MPTIRVAAIIIKHHQMLVEEDPATGTLALPGGRVGADETLELALSREIREELGHAIEVGPLVYLIENRFVGADGPVHELGYYFLARSLAIDSDPDPTPAVPHLEPPLRTRWVDVTHLPHLPFVPARLRNHLMWDLVSGFPDGCRAFTEFGAADDALQARHEALPRFFRKHDFGFPEGQLAGFEAFADFDDRLLQRLIGKVDHETLCYALFGVERGVAERFYVNMSERKAAMVHEDMAALAPADAARVRQAQLDMIKLTQRWLLRAASD